LKYEAEFKLQKKKNLKRFVLSRLSRKSSSYGDPWPISDQLDIEDASYVTLISSHCMGNQPVRKGQAAHTHAY
jgi:hypothetical protein